MNKRIGFAIFLSVALFVGVGFKAVSSIKTMSAAYIYGYPLLIMNETKKTMLLNGLAENQLNHISQFPDHTFRNVVRPNVDTLYTIAWLNLKDEPQVLSVPDTDGRYYVSPFMDAWTNVFAEVGKRTTGTEAGEYALLGPDWQGEIPEGLRTIKAPTNMVWMIQRIQTNGKEDIPAVANLQQKFSLVSLSQWKQGIPAESKIDTISKSGSQTNPYEIIDEMSAAVLFNTLATLMNEQSPSSHDQEALKTLQSIGISPGNYDPSTHGWFGRMLADIAIDITHKKIKERLDEGFGLENSWAIRRQGLGRYDTNYEVRTGVAIIGLGALPPEEAVYPNTSLDSELMPLSGKNSYTIKFTADTAPPVNAFWSLTMYDEHGFLVDNPIARYAIGDRDALHYNANGSLEIVIQNEQPKENKVNWLPSPRGDFALTLRLYLPKQSVLTGQWPLPSVIKH